MTDMPDGFLDYILKNRIRLDTHDIGWVAYPKGGK